MRFSGKLALKVGAVGVAAGVVLAPATSADAATPAISVTPSTHLMSGQTVTVTGSGFAASVPFAVGECGSASVIGSCDNLVVGMTGADGSIPSTQYTVTVGTFGDGTCPPAVASDPCYIAVTTDPSNITFDKTAVAPITFAVPKVIVMPATDVKDGATVMLSGADFAASTGVFAVECAGSGSGAPPAQADCDGDTLATGETDAAGVFSGLNIVVHTGAVGDKTCDAGGSCDVVVTTSVTDPDATNSGIGTFTFAATTPGGGTSGRAATTTEAAYSSKKQAIFGAVTAGGTGVKGLKTKLEIKKGSHWKRLDSGKTKVGGAFLFTHVTKSGTYEVKTSKGSTFKGSTSNKITV